LEVLVLSRLQHHLRFANVVSLMALFVALSGGAYALTIPRNSVGAQQLKRSAVTRSKIRNGAVTAAKVKGGSLLAKNFKPGQLPAGPLGDAGPSGDCGAAGAPGTARAYAFVDTINCPGGSCALIRAKNIASVRRVPGDTGAYCVAATFPLDPTNDIVMSGVDERNSFSPEAAGTTHGDATEHACDAAFPGTLGIYTWRLDAGTNNTFSPSDTVSFWLAIP
jgi:hypothetical protein